MNINGLLIDLVSNQLHLRDVLNPSAILHHQNGRYRWGRGRT
jgi:hypothetical protein